MYLESARSLVTVSLLNISVILRELRDSITEEEEGNLSAAEVNLNAAWENLEAVRKTMTARIGHDTTLESYLEV